MDNTEMHSTQTDQRSTDRFAPSPSDAIAISAADLIKVINETGQGMDVDELVNRMLRDRLAA